MAAPAVDAHIIAARRTPLGRIGGLHRARRIEDLAAPVITAVLRDATTSVEQVDGLIIGATTVGGNPARLIGLAAGIRDTVPAFTVDRQCASGLDAILLAVQDIASGRAGMVVAGGADSVSTSPWRIAKPKNLYQLPHFLSSDPMHDLGADETQNLEALEDLARARGIDRDRQDAWTFAAHMRADAAREARRLVGEIVALRATTEEARDESAAAPRLADIAAMTSLLPPDGIVTRGATSVAHDGAAMVLVVSGARWEALGRPPSLRVTGQAAVGVRPDDEATAGAAAVARLLEAAGGASGGNAVGVIEFGERSAIEAIAFAEATGFDPGTINLAGGGVVRGHALAATGAVLVTRLFSEMIRHPANSRRTGLAALGVLGGLGVAAMFAVHQ